MTVAITGITGNMGQAAFKALADANVDEIRLLIRSPKRFKKLLNANKALRDKVTVVSGGMTDRNAIKQLVQNADLVINMAAVIPPRSDQNPQAAVDCNQTGTDILVSEIESIQENKLGVMLRGCFTRPRTRVLRTPCAPRGAVLHQICRRRIFAPASGQKCSSNQPALVHISTVAVYGDRSGAHPFGRVGDPLLASPLDVYSATKMRGEFRVLESGIAKWAILRQSAMLHPQMLSDNIHDGLMFHTTFFAPLEWVTAYDSGVLIRNIVNRFADGSMPDKFWKRCYNIAGGKNNRRYGMQTFDDGFKVVGGSTKDFFKPGYNAARNFHGVWYLDCDELNDMFRYQSQTPDAYWQEIFKAHPIFKLGKIVPKRIIGYFVVKRLLKDKNAPAYWAKHNDEAKMIAYFGGRDKYDALQQLKWKDYPLKDGTEIQNMTDNETPINYGYDIQKPDSEITHADVAAVAEAHGGKLLSEYDGDMYKKLEFVTQDGEKFTARAYTVLRAGHWYNPLYKEFVWDFDRLSKADKIFASVWYDSHDKDEDYVYSLDSDFVAHAKKF